MHVLKKNALMIGCIILVGMVGLTGCAKKAPVEDMEKPGAEATATATEPVETRTVTVGTLKGPTSIGMIQMIEEAPVLNENVDVQYEIIPSPDVLIAKMLSGEIDIATVPTNAAAIVYNKGLDYRLAATTIWGVMYGVGTDASIGTIADLKGKDVYSVGKGVTPDVVARYLLQEEGIDPETEVQFQYGTPPTELAQLMVAGKVDLAILPEPFVTMVTMQNQDMKVLFDIQASFNSKVGNGEQSLAQTCVVVKGALADEEPDFVNAFLKGYEQSVKWVNENPADASVLVEKHGVLPKAKIAELAIPRLNMEYVSAEDSSEAVGAYLQVLYDFSPETIGGQMPDEGFYIHN